MGRTFRNQLLELLYDLNDDLKVNLITLNSTKELFMNGPSQELLKRAFNISYHQGQKQAIEALRNITEAENNDQHLQHVVHRYINEFTDASSNLNALSEQQLASQTDLAQVIDNHYHHLGQKQIMTQVQHLLKQY